MTEESSILCGQQVQPVVVPALLTVSEAASFLGLKTKCIHQLVRERKLSCVQLTARERRFTPEQLNDFIQRQTVPVLSVDKHRHTSVLLPLKGVDRKKGSTQQPSPSEQVSSIREEIKSLCL